MVVGSKPWPPHLEAAAGAPARRLVPRGCLFEHFVDDPVEPRRSGIYQFCVVGMQISEPGVLHYHAWEPTGHLDRLFAADELERHMAVARFSRHKLAAGGKAALDAHRAYDKDGISFSTAVRWPDSSSEGPLLCERLLPEVDESGTPILPAGCPFPARNTADLLGPLVEHWKRNFRGIRPLSRPQPRVLVLDGTGRLAYRLQVVLPHAEITAADAAELALPPARRGQALGLFRERGFHVDRELLDIGKPALRCADRAFDVVMLPFTLHRLCRGDEKTFLESVELKCRPDDLEDGKAKCSQVGANDSESSMTSSSSERSASKQVLLRQVSGLSTSSSTTCGRSSLGDIDEDLCTAWYEERATLVFPPVGFVRSMAQHIESQAAKAAVEKTESTRPPAPQVVRIPAAACQFIGDADEDTVEQNARERFYIGETSEASGSSTK